MSLKVPAEVALCVGVVVVGCAGFASLSLLKPHPKEKSTEELVRPFLVSEISTEPVCARVSAYGTVRARQEVLLSAQVLGCVSRLREPLKAGVTVKAGEFLLEIDPLDYRLALRKASAEFDRISSEHSLMERRILDAKAFMEVVRRDRKLQVASFERTQALYEKKVRNTAEFESAQQSLELKTLAVLTAESEFETSNIKLKTLAAQVALAAAERDTAELNLQRCTVSAPFDGRVAEVWVEQGEYVSVGGKLLQLDDDSVLEVGVSIDAADAATLLGLRIEPSASGNWFVADSQRFSAEVSTGDTNRRGTLPAVLLRVDKFDAATRTLMLTFGLKGGAGGLVPGMFCKVELSGRELSNAVRIPWSAVQLDNDVFVLEAESRIHERKVEILGSTGDFAIVGAGLRPGERIVVQKLPRDMVDGTRIKPVEAAVDTRRQD